MITYLIPRIIANFWVNYRKKFCKLLTKDGFDILIFTFVYSFSNSFEEVVIKQEKKSCP